MGDEAGAGDSILIVDDSPTMLAYLRAALEDEGLEIRDAHDGLAGFQMLLKLRPRLMICDLQMPGISGLKLLELRASRPDLGEIPVIMLTAESEPETKVKVLDAGAADYITKPFHQKELAARVRVHLRVRSLADELRATNERLSALATTDGLTKLLNRRSFDERLTDEIARAVRYEVPVSLLLVDIDHFKKFNDTYGHQLGDEVLRQVGAGLKGALRQTDIAARYGGEEFIIILPHTTADGALLTAERLRAVIGALVITAGTDHITVTASIGVACCQGANASGEALIQRADAALYAAKDGGRNRVVVGS